MPQRLNAGTLLAAGAGAALLVSLFLDWFEPGMTAWTAFEVVDLALAAIALIAVVAALGEPLGRPAEGGRAAAWLPLAAAAGLVLVVGALINHPPAAVGLGTDYGAWIALGAVILLAVGALLRTTEISLVISRRESDFPEAGPLPPEAEPVSPEAETTSLPPETEP
jgi:hypothetical protein